MNFSGHWCDEIKNFRKKDSEKFVWNEIKRTFVPALEKAIIQAYVRGAFWGRKFKKTKNKFAGNEKVRTFAIRASKNGAKEKSSLTRLEEQVQASTETNL